MKIDYKKIYNKFIDAKGIKPNNCYDAYRKGYKQALIDLENKKIEKIRLGVINKIIVDSFLKKGILKKKEDKNDNTQR